MARIAAVVLARPSLVPAALVTAKRLVPRRWWATAPYLPLPDPAYMRFRMVTAYGDSDHAGEPADVATYLRWSGAWRAVIRSAR